MASSNAATGLAAGAVTGGGGRGVATMGGDEFDGGGAVMAAGAGTVSVRSGPVTLDDGVRVKVLRDGVRAGG